MLLKSQPKIQAKSHPADAVAEALADVRLACRVCSARLKQVNAFDVLRVKAGGLLRLLASLLANAVSPNQRPLLPARAKTSQFDREVSAQQFNCCKQLNATTTRGQHGDARERAHDNNGATSTQEILPSSATQQRRKHTTQRLAQQLVGQGVQCLHLGAPANDG